MINKINKNWKIDKHDAIAKLFKSGVWNRSIILIEIVEGVDGASMNAISITDAE